MTSPTAACPNCGVRRLVRRVEPNYLCYDCKTANHHNNRDNYVWPEHTIALPAGQWVRNGLVWTYIEAPPADPNELIEHGTERGYQQHRHKNVPYCDNCREAHRLNWHATKQVAA